MAIIQYVEAWRQPQRPVIVEYLVALCRRLAESGVTIAIVDQDVQAAANPSNGSSSNISRGERINARAIASICCSPPGSVPAQNTPPLAKEWKRWRKFHRFCGPLASDHSVSSRSGDSSAENCS
jgi:hypothetical protein